METIKLKGTARTIGNKQSLKQLRLSGQVPCVIYGQNVGNINFSVSENDLKKITHTPKSYIINIEIDSKEYTCIFHDIQYHPVTDKALHVDFLAISQVKPVVRNFEANRQIFMIQNQNLQKVISQLGSAS